ncbi:hypothetical protein [Metallibacterium sp.]|uniref:hypothetical protein n=1 Tax=Metallibacterium sp. TaxID=2940281 RepID=UPI0026294E4B|nr:hypothetical protein [Metallibacterium sp.]
MGLIVLWAEADHKNRAELLAKTYGTTAYNITDTEPVSVPNMDTLTFWGHGDAYKFCSMDEDEFLAMVLAWKKANKQISTVEMISCNLRHRMGNQRESFTAKVIAKIKRKHADIRFKALPVARSGMGVTCENSILKWQPSSQTWAYCATPGKEDRYMWAVCKMLEDRMPPRGDRDGYVRAYNQLLGEQFTLKHKFGKDKLGSIVMEPCSLSNMLCVANNAHVSTGTIGTLRWSLVDIK